MPLTQFTSLLSGKLGQLMMPLYVQFTPNTCAVVLNTFWR
ncbi:hypothetical protein Slin_6355 [Spirosoma linguale DSM 74]|uniref:Uncharacterized protein n=1 Tax=Spirosoma linguale (strain ATCC 33905 / DSM 74 / LMG 10896 / Claus 1) TaxID=504472 RepID=D2QU32_SPILD|nr:hypothetical protein Slin_6355 [Spirosoma linguale DSM 74]